MSNDAQGIDVRIIARDKMQGEVAAFDSQRGFQVEVNRQPDFETFHSDPTGLVLKISAPSDQQSKFEEFEKAIQTESGIGANADEALKLAGIRLKIAGETRNIAYYKASSTFIDALNKHQIIDHVDHERLLNDYRFEFFVADEIPKGRGR